MERTRERHGDDYDARLAAADDEQHGEGRDAEHSAEHDARHGNLAGRTTRDPARGDGTTGEATGHGPIDLAPAADRLMGLIPLVEDDRLDDPTPCQGRSVRELLGHLLGLTLAFRAAAEKDLGDLTDHSPDENGWPEATGDWRERLAEQLPALVTAWYPQDAWSGHTRVGGVDLPGEAAGVVGLGELVLHGWDLARALGRPYDCDEESARVLGIYVEGFDPAGTPGVFGPAVAPDADAQGFDRVLARSGRNPAWEHAAAGQAS
jgi:uncharacterized protein (TIGR03086 family)